MKKMTAEENAALILEGIRRTKDIGNLVGFYLHCREKKEAIKREYANALTTVEPFMESIEGRLMELLQDSGQESARTTFGTCFMKSSTSTKVADWNVLLDYIKKNDAFDLLYKNVAKDAVIARVEETGKVVPGVDMVTFKSIQVRKAVG